MLQINRLTEIGVRCQGYWRSFASLRTAKWDIVHPRIPRSGVCIAGNRSAWS